MMHTHILFAMYTSILWTEVGGGGVRGVVQIVGLILSYQYCILEMCSTELLVDIAKKNFVSTP